MNIKKTLATTALATTVFLTGFQAQETNTITNQKGPGGYSITALDRVGERTIGGYFDTEYSNNIETSSNTFKAHRLILQLSSQLHKNLLSIQKLNMNMADMLQMQMMTATSSKDKSKLNKHGLISN